jgi:hypothetical protein
MPLAVRLLDPPSTTERYCPAQATAAAVRQALADQASPAVSGDEQILRAWRAEHPTAGAWQLHEARIRAAQESLIRSREAGR